MLSPAGARDAGASSSHRKASCDFIIMYCMAYIEHVMRNNDACAAQGLPWLLATVLSQNYSRGLQAPFRTAGQPPCPCAPTRPPVSDALLPPHPPPSASEPWPNHTHQINQKFGFHSPQVSDIECSMGVTPESCFILSGACRTACMLGMLWHARPVRASQSLQALQTPICGVII